MSGDARYRGPQIKSVDPAEFLDLPENETRGRGRPRLLTAAQAALLFEAQVAELAARELQDRILDEAGVSRGNRGQRLGAARGRLLIQNWVDRGRIDVVHETRPRKGGRCHVRAN